MPLKDDKALMEYEFQLKGLIAGLKKLQSALKEVEKKRDKDAKEAEKKGTLSNSFVFRLEIEDLGTEIDEKEKMITTTQAKISALKLR